MNAIWLFTVDLCGVAVRILECQGKRWLCAEDAARVMGYTTHDGIRNLYHRHKENLAGHSINAKIDGEGWQVNLFDEFSLCYLCSQSKKTGASNLFRWINTGGLQTACDDKISFDQTHSLTPAVNTPEEATTKPSNILSLVNNAADLQAGTKKESFMALDKRSQATCKPVLFFDANATSIDLKDNAIYRMDAANDLLHSVACFYNSDDPNAVSNIANVASMLLSDASRIFDVLLNRLSRYEGH